jgi:hypothetical protein
VGRYELRYFDSGGQKFAAYDFDADDDAQALARACFLARLKAPVFEVWQGGRMVRRETANVLFPLGPGEEGFAASPHATVGFS